MGWDWTIGLMHYGSRLQKHRMLLRQFLHRTAMKRHHGILALETHRLVASLIESPDKYLDHVRRYGFPVSYEPDLYKFTDRATVAIIMMICYGHEGISF
jgi:hypothetical protein